MSNPYAAPDADIRAPGEAEEYQPKIFSLNGRIGRARYLGWGMLLNLLAFIPLGIIAALVFPNMSADSSSAPMLLMIPAYALLIFVSYVMARRRFHDLNRSSWFFLTLIIPIVNILATLYLLFWPGTLGSNNFGPPPVKNSSTIWIILVLGLVISIGILAAVGIPACLLYTSDAADE